MARHSHCGTTESTRTTSIPVPGSRKRTKIPRIYWRSPIKQGAPAKTRRVFDMRLCVCLVGCRQLPRSARLSPRDSWRRVWSRLVSEAWSPVVGQGCMKRAVSQSISHLARAQRNERTTNPEREECLWVPSVTSANTLGSWGARRGMVVSRQCARLYLRFRTVSMRSMRRRAAGDGGFLLGRVGVS
jgi:hypothetical protein